ncbi:riboflavin synthase, partial [bacterium]|nr:riboflavin synthase [bacterium]
EKGSLAVHGVSLTVARYQSGQATLALIPATLESTLLGEMPSGAKVNLEVDIIAKYVESLVNPQAGRIDHDKLAGWGFA